MPLSRFIATGSNTTVKTGSGQLFGIIAGGANGGTVFALDSISIGVTPSYPGIAASVASNLTVIGPLTAAPSEWDLYGTPFVVGLTVAATSNASLTVFYA